MVSDNRAADAWFSVTLVQSDTDPDLASREHFISEVQLASTPDIEAWLEVNEPDGPQQLLALHEAFENLTDETLYSAEEVKGTTLVHGPLEPRTLVLPTERSRNFFRGKLRAYKADPDLDFDEEADFDRAINNPRS